MKIFLKPDLLIDFDKITKTESYILQTTGTYGLLVFCEGLENPITLNREQREEFLNKVKYLAERTFTTGFKLFDEMIPGIPNWKLLFPLVL